MTSPWYDNPWIIGAGSILIVLALIAAPTLIMLSRTDRSISETWRAKVALCDRAVDALVNSTELVEVTRAGIIIRELDCSIGRRLPRARGRRARWFWVLSSFGLPAAMSAICWARSRRRRSSFWFNDHARSDHGHGQGALRAVRLVPGQGV
jgi:hypothetical protein